MTRSVKLSVTMHQRLARKYPAAALKAIDHAIAAWVRADAARGLTTVHVALDDAAAMRTHGVAAVTGTVTAAKVKRAIDALATKLTPDYIAIIGSADVVPMFLVANPSAAGDGDDDDNVPTDNPYACTRPFSTAVRKSYLVPDRVVGRIPDLPGSRDPSWLIDGLAHASGAKPRAAADYRAAMFVCCRTWKGAGEECARTLGHTASEVLISPPTTDGEAAIKARRARRLHMIKCHGAREDSRFYGEGSSVGPDSLSSTTLLGRTRADTVVGAMCCYGADLFDPTSPTAQYPGEPPIASVYLKQGAHGYFGASTIAWVGITDMQCADWMVTAFLKSATGGASIGRAALEAKQDFLRWRQQQGSEPDAADEKTLLQFVLLGDPSIHPVRAEDGAANRAVAAALPRKARAVAAAPAAARRRRRLARLELGGVIRSQLSTRDRHVAKRPSSDVERVKRALSTELAPAAKQTRWRAWTDRLVASPTAAVGRAVTAAAGPAARVRPAARTERRSYQYYWVTERRDDGVRRISMVIVHADARGQVLEGRVVVSS